VEDRPVDAAGTLEKAVPSAPDYPEALETARDRRPEIHEMDHRLGIQEEIIKIERAGNKPSLDFHAGYGRRKYWVADLQSQGRVWNAGIFLTFPLFDGMRTRGRVIQARSDFTTLEIEMRKLQDAVALEVRTALDSYLEAEEIVKALSGTVEQAEKLLTMSEKGFEYGVKTRLEVDDAQLNLSQARANLARARRDHLVARTNLDWVMGVLGESPSK
jgi:HAE1 family hydrophobic/amphiphilic exporter-1